MNLDKLYTDPELVQFYDIENEESSDLGFLLRLADNADTILDLGCGTGKLAATLAASTGKRVFGVDPAEPMLDVARQRAGGAHVTWINGDARCIELSERFDLVILSGHAFQVFLTREDQLAVLQTIAKHLAPSGCFIFDSRNPLVEEWQEWTPAESRRLIHHPVFGKIVAWNDVTQDPSTGIVEYGTYYRLSANGQLYSARSSIAFPSREQLASLIVEAGLAVKSWFGDWQGNSYAPSSSEIIPLGGLCQDWLG